MLPGREEEPRLDVVTGLDLYAQTNEQRNIAGVDAFVDVAPDDEGAANEHVDSFVHVDRDRN